MQTLKKVPAVRALLLWVLFVHRKQQKLSAAYTRARKLWHKAQANLLLAEVAGKISEEKFFNPQGKKLPEQIKKEEIIKFIEQQTLYYK